MNDDQQCDCGWPVDGECEHGPDCSSIACNRMDDDGGCLIYSPVDEVRHD